MRQNYGNEVFELHIVLSCSTRSMDVILCLECLLSLNHNGEE